MKYDQEKQLREYARRTLSNLKTIQLSGEHDGQASASEVTQLISSLLGLVTLPVERYYQLVPAIPLAELTRLGWALPTVSGDFPQAQDLCELLHHLRSAIAHFSLLFTSDAEGRITGLLIQNHWRDKLVWEATLDVDQLRDLTLRLAELIAAPPGRQYVNCREHHRRQVARVISRDRLF